MKALDRLNKIRESEIMEAVNSLTDMAIENRNVVHIFVHITPHTNEISASAYPVDTDWSSNDRTMLIFESIALDKEDTLLKLLEVEDKLIELIAEARDQQDSEAAA